MGDGFIQLLVVAFFIIISMMDGAARKRRKQAQSLGRPSEPSEPGVAGDLSEIKSAYDPFGAADDLDQAAESSEESKGMVPVDLWEEIAAMARGEVAERGVGSRSGPATRDPISTDDADPEMEAWTAPEQDVSQVRVAGTEGGERGQQSPGRFERLDAPAPTTRPADLQGGYLHPDQAVTHKEHAQVASSARPLPLEDQPHEFVLHPPEQPSKPQKELRRVQKPGGLLSEVRLGARRSLRDAIIVAEVLSPPVTLRDSGWKPLF